jgi:hypothetical protein
MAVNLSPLAGAGWQFSDNNGDPLTGGLLYTYAAGTTAPQVTYTTNAGTIPNTNPIVLDSAGRTSNEVWLTEGSVYKFVLKNSSNVLIGTYDNIVGINDVTSQTTFATDLANTTDITKGDALVGFRQADTNGLMVGAVARTVHSKLTEFVSILDFGADPTGVADSTLAIQNCLTAAGPNASIHFPEGTYLLSATLTGSAGQHLFGDGVNQTVLRRFADYGDTLYFANIGSGSVRGMWFYHGTLPSSGFTSLTNKVTSGAHIHIGNGQSAIIEDVWMWRMQYQVRIDQGSGIRMNRISAQGCWNANAGSAAQEGIAGVAIGLVNYCVLVEITNSYLAGSDGGPVSVPFVTADAGTKVVNFTSSNAGNLYGIQVLACEGLYIANTYIGGNASNNILISPNNICAQIRISNNFFDGASYSSPCIYFEPIVNGYYAFNVTLNDNNFNGQLYAYQAIGSINSVGTSPTIACFTFDGNSFVNGLGSAIFLRNAQDGIISSNQIASYNSRNLSPGGDVNFCNAIYLTQCVSVLVDGNIVGGAINSGAVGGYTYRSIDFGGTINNLTEKNTVHVGTGPSANIVGKSDGYVVTTSANYTCTGVEDFILTNSSANVIQIFLPTNPPKGMTITVKDAAGSLTTNNIGVIGTIDGATNLVMGTNRMSRTFTWDGNTTWVITAGYL